MSKFWLIYEPVLSSTVVGIVDGILVDQTPSFLDSIRLTTFTLGTKAPRVESIKSYPKSDPDIVVRLPYFPLYLRGIISILVPESDKKYSSPITNRLGISIDPFLS